MGNQQGNASGDGVVAGRERSVLHKHNGFNCSAFCFGQSRVQVIKHLIADLVQTSGTIQSPKGDSSRRLIRKFSIIRHEVVVTIDPCQEIGSPGSQRQAIRYIELVARLDGIAINLHRSSRGEFDRDLVGCVCFSNGKISQIDISRIGTTTRTCDNRFNGFVGSKLYLALHIVSRADCSTLELYSSTASCFPLKGNIRIIGCSVFNRNCIRSDIIGWTADTVIA